MSSGVLVVLLVQATVRPAGVHLRTQFTCLDLYPLAADLSLLVCYT